MICAIVLASSSTINVLTTNIYHPVPFLWLMVPRPGNEPGTFRWLMVTDRSVLGDREMFSTLTLVETVQSIR